MTIAELFVSIGVKGNDKSKKALEGVKGISRRSEIHVARGESRNRGRDLRIGAPNECQCPTGY